MAARRCGSSLFTGYDDAYLRAIQFVQQAGGLQGRQLFGDDEHMEAAAHELVQAVAARAVVHHRLHRQLPPAGTRVPREEALDEARQAHRLGRLRLRAPGQEDRSSAPRPAPESRSVCRCPSSMPFSVTVRT